jgi:methyl-accepting chemotaxis protein
VKDDVNVNVSVQSLISADISSYATPEQSTRKITGSKSLFKPIIIALSLISLVGAAGLALQMYASFIAPLDDKFLEQSLVTTQSELGAMLQSKVEEGKAMAVSINGYAEIIQGLKDGDRDPIAEKLQDIKKHFASQSKYKNIGVQVIDADDVSFVKSWNVDSFGEAVKHPMLTEMHKTKQVVGGIGVGAQGFSVLAFAPAKEKDRHLGTVVVSGGVAAVVKELKQKSLTWVLFLDKAYLDKRYGAIPGSLAENKLVDTWVIANNNWFDKSAVETIEKHKDWLSKDELPRVRLVGDTVVMDIPLFDELNQFAGRSIVFKSADELRAQIATAEKATYNLVMELVFALLLLVLIILYIIKIKAISPIRQLTQDIFSIATESKFNRTLVVKQMDEIGQVYASVNRLLKQLDTGISEANRVVEAAANGDFSQRMNSQYVGDLNKLKLGVNSSIENMSNAMMEVLQALDAMSVGRFDVLIDLNASGAYGDMLHKVSLVMKTLDAVIRDINATMGSMSQGDFAARVNADTYGELLVMKNSVNRSMEGLSIAIDDITRVITAQANGDLTQASTADLAGQLKALQNAINTSSEKLTSVVSQAMSVSDIVSQTASQVHNDANHLSDRIQRQAASLEQTSASMNEMSEAVQANTANARQVADLVLQVQNRSVSGAGVMQQTIDAMQSIRESSHKISDIVTLIDGIAFQTNLLALNAAVEAARAGEHGRGFAVVAGEVRALAQKSADAAKDIKTLIDDSVSRIANGTHLAEKSGEVLTEITQAIKEVTGMVESIAHASHEQSQGIAQVHKAIAEIDSVTQQNAALVEETTSAAENLNHEANNLRHNMGFFTTSSNKRAEFVAERMPKKLN